MTVKKRTILVLSIVVSVGMFAPNGVMAACLGDKSAQPLKVYIVPQLTASQIYTRWGPLLDQIGKNTEQCFDLIVPVSIPQFEADLANGRPDFVFMNPYHMAMKWRNHQYVPLVASSEPIFGLITVRRDGKQSSLKDLSGSKIGFPAPNAFAASLLIRSMLATNGIAFEPDYLKTHSNVYRSVARGDVTAGGGIHATLSAEPPELQDELRILMETKRYTAHPFSASARVPVVIQKRVQTAFLNLAKTNEGAELLNRIQLAKPMEVTYKDNYQALEALKLEKYVVKSAD
jgi:phosphonate transport system substrate-binding protein